MVFQKVYVIKQLHRAYSDRVTILKNGDKYINKHDRPFMLQTMFVLKITCKKKKLLGGNNKDVSL